MTLAGAIFDLDGTLADTLPACYAAFRAAGVQVGGRAYTDAQIRELFGPSEEGMVQRAMPARWREALAGRGGRWDNARMSTVSVRYIVTDVDAAIAFYTERLGFHLDIHPAPGFARLSRGGLHLLLNRPGAGGAGQAMSDGQAPAPGGWNRVQLEIPDLNATVGTLKADGCRFRSEIITGNGGRQILVEDPSGNPIELFEPFSPDAPSPARRTSGGSPPAR